MADRVGIGMVGLGYWGPNLFRNFLREERAAVKVACDLEEKNLAPFRAQNPTVQFTTSFEDVLSNPDVDAVVIATPLPTHVKLTEAALKAGKHVLVEKPLAPTAKEAAMLVQLAKKQGKLLLVDHPFLFESAVEKLKELIDDGTMGDLLYVDSTRINLGLLRPDSNVLWDLAVHDLSILDYLQPLSGVDSVSAQGEKHYTDREEIAHLFLRYRSGLVAHIHVSWLSPVKIRQMLVGGTKKMAVWDDNNTAEKIRVYDRGVELPRGAATFAPTYRRGDAVSPQLESVEPLRRLAAHFVDCIQSGATPHTPGERSIRIMEILEAAETSMKKQAAISLSA